MNCLTDHGSPRPAAQLLCLWEKAGHGVEHEGDGNGLVRFNGVEHAIGAGEENESLDILMGLTDPEFAEVSQLEGVTENESQDFAAEKSHVFVEQESAACITE